MTRRRADARRPARVVAAVGAVVATVAIAVAAGVEKVETSGRYAGTTPGGATYSGVFSAAIDVPYRIVIAAIAIVVIGLAVVVLSNLSTRVRRIHLALIATGSLLLASWLGFLLVEYLDLNGEVG